MSEFNRTLRERAATACTAARDARSAGEDFLADVHEADFSDLVRIGHDHGIELG